MSVLRTLQSGGVEQLQRQDSTAPEGKVCLGALAYRRVIPARIRQKQQRHQVEHLTQALSKLELHLYATCARGGGGFMQ